MIMNYKLDLPEVNFISLHSISLVFWKFPDFLAAYLQLHHHSQSSQVKQKPLSTLNLPTTGYRGENISHCHGHLFNHCA